MGKAIFWNILGFLGCLLLFVMLTWLSGQIRNTCGVFAFTCGDAVRSYGFPFVFMESGGLILPGDPPPYASPIALLIDLAIGLFGSLASGAMLQYRLVHR